jgi:hypothetical protein
MVLLEYLKQSHLGYVAGLHFLLMCLLQYQGIPCGTVCFYFHTVILVVLFQVIVILLLFAPISYSGGSVYPMVVAAHPLEPNQIAVGMSDGAVHVVEPLDADPKWGVAPPQDNGAHPAMSSAPAASNNQASDQPTR